MLEELKEEAIVNKVGGRFKLSTLIQKRLVQLNRGGRPLVDMNSEDKMEIVIQEILQDKIYLKPILQRWSTGSQVLAGNQGRASRILVFYHAHLFSTESYFLLHSLLENNFGDVSIWMTSELPVSARRSATGSSDVIQILTSPKLFSNKECNKK